jgi:monoamine oxidase
MNHENSPARNHRRNHPNAVRPGFLLASTRARKWQGYMNGAIASGLRATEEISALFL